MIWVAIAVGLAGGGLIRFLQRPRLAWQTCPGCGHTVTGPSAYRNCPACGTGW